MRKIGGFRGQSYRVNPHRQLHLLHLPTCSGRVGLISSSVVALRLQYVSYSCTRALAIS